jgi:hypothetical protein
VPQLNSLVRLHQHSMSELLYLLPNLPLTVTGSIRFFEVEVTSNQGKFPSLESELEYPLFRKYRSAG